MYDSGGAPSKKSGSCYLAQALRSAQKGSGATRDISVVMRPFHASGMLLRECHRPFVLPRPTTAPTATPKRELSLTNAMGQLDACDRDGRIRECLESGHRRTAPLDRAVVL